MNVDYIDKDNVFQTIADVVSMVPVKNGLYFLVKTATTEQTIKATSFVEVTPTV